MSGRLDGKKAIITGAGTGIGEAIAHKFAREGADLLLNGLPGDPVQDVADAIRQQYGRQVEVFEGDVSDSEKAHAAIEQALSAFNSRLDILVNNAGVFLFTGETQDYPEELAHDTIHKNILSTFNMTRLALPHLQRSKGNVVSAGSEAGQMGIANNTVYGGTKAFLHAFMKGVAVEQGKYGVRANCVCPGPIDTAWTHPETGPMNDDMEEGLVSQAVFGRRGTPEEIANVYAFIASDEASYVTGALFYVDGGTTVVKGGIGKQAPDDIRREPEGHLKLVHSKDGMANKKTASAL